MQTENVIFILLPKSIAYAINFGSAFVHCSSSHPEMGVSGWELAKQRE